MRQPSEIICPNGKTLEEVLRLHSLWLEDDPTGECADLQGANLQSVRLWNVNLLGANLSDTNLQYANLWNANLQYATLQHANLQDAKMRYADLQGVRLWNANLQGANLGCANLQGANMQDANLQGVMLWNTTGNRTEIKTLQTESYTINLCKDRLQIGCKNYSLSEWQAFTDDEITKMGYEALQWWKRYKEFVFNWVELEAPDMFNKGEKNDKVGK